MMVRKLPQGRVGCCNLSSAAINSGAEDHRGGSRDWRKIGGTGWAGGSKLWDQASNPGTCYEWDISFLPGGSGTSQSQHSDFWPLYMKLYVEEPGKHGRQTMGLESL